MIYSLSLGTAMAIAGAVLLVLGLIAALRGSAAQAWLKALPRSLAWGYGLLAIATIWFFYLIATIDLGEFDNWRSRFLVLIPIAAILTARFVDEFLSARALGMLVLLAAEPLLESAFLQPQLSRLFLVSFVYVAIVAGMFWVGMPYLLRDTIGWFTKTERRWKTGALASIGYGALLLICCLTLHRSS